MSRVDVGIDPYNVYPRLMRSSHLVVGTAVPSRPRTDEDICPYKYDSTML